VQILKGIEGVAFPKKPVKIEMSVSKVEETFKEIQKVRLRFTRSLYLPLALN